MPRAVAENTSLYVNIPKHAPTPFHQHLRHPLASTSLARVSSRGQAVRSTSCSLSRPSTASWRRPRSSRSTSLPGDSAFRQSVTRQTLGQAHRHQRDAGLGAGSQIVTNAASAPPGPRPRFHLPRVATPGGHPGFTVTSQTGIQDPCQSSKHGSTQAYGAPSSTHGARSLPHSPGSSRHRPLLISFQPETAVTGGAAPKSRCSTSLPPFRRPTTSTESRTLRRTVARFSCAPFSFTVRHTTRRPPSWSLSMRFPSHVSDHAVGEIHLV